MTNLKSDAQKKATHVHTAYSLAFFIQQVEQSCGLFADEVYATRVVYVVYVMPADAF